MSDLNHTGGTTDATPQHSARRGALSILIALVIGSALAVGGWFWWQYAKIHPSAQDAYLNANTVNVAAQVDGRVVDVLVVDNLRVSAGELLFRIDPRDYQAALTAAESAAILTAQRITVQKSAVTAAEARVREQQAMVANAKELLDRTRKLVAKGDEPRLHGIQVENDYRAALATLDDQQAELKVAREQLGTPAIQKARIDQAQAAVEQARLRLEWTEVKAPRDGWVTRVTLRQGDFVSAGSPQFVLVEDGDWWVQANYKEGQAGAIQPGMPAQVTIDMYDTRPFTGTVESIGPASAASFSLLPAQNTTGNWVKVTQRIPVRIRMEPFDPSYPYRMGASTSVTVLTTSGSASSPTSPTARDPDKVAPARDDD